MKYQRFYLTIFKALYGSHSQTKDGLYFPNFMYFSTYFPNFNKTFPTCEGKGIFLKSQIKSLSTLIIACAPGPQLKIIFFISQPKHMFKLMNKKIISILCYFFSLTGPMAHLLGWIWNSYFD